MSSTFNPYEAPKTEFTEGPFVPDEIELATIFQRILARVIDHLILNLVAVVIVLIFILVVFLSLGSEEAINRLDEVMDQDSLNVFKFNLLDPSVWGSIILIHVIFLVLHGFLLLRYGQTIGKRLLKIAIVDADTYEKVPLPRLFLLRYLIWDIPALFIGVVNWIIRIVDLAFGLKDDRRTLHDLTANTIVIKVNRLTTSTGPL